MAVFPESMNKLDVNDTTGSLRRIENYIRYMTERVEFSMRNMTRNVSDAGVSSVEILLLVQELATGLSTISSTVNGMAGEITSLNNRVTEVQESQTEMATNVADIQTQITDLTDRVDKIEGNTGTE